jgi:RNA polymerase sigma factor (sigma-70 family)
MTLEEAYGIYEANPTDENSGIVFEAVLSFAKKFASQRLNQRQLGSIDDPVQDAAKKVWIELHKEHHYNPSDGPFGGWVRTVIAHTMTDWVRGQRRGLTVSLDDPMYHLPEDVEVTGKGNPYKQILHKEMYAKLEGDDKALVTDLLNGMTIAQLADKRGVSTMTIRRMAERIMEKVSAKV